MPEPSTAELVRAAAADDQSAWHTLVHRFGGLVWAIAREHGLSTSDAADVSQATWLNLARQLPRLRCPERLAGWLATTARREAQRAVVARGRELPVDRLAMTEPAAGPEQTVLAADVETVVWRALAELPQRCRQLLRLVAHAPELSYAQAARALGIQLGSVGPIRGRCLAALRRKLTSAGLLEGIGW